MSTAASQPASAWPLRAHEVTVAAAWLVLLAATWRLWTPQTVFPQAPLLSIARSAPVASEWLAVAGLVFALAVQLVVVSPAARRGLWLVTLALTAWLIVVDQNRAQAWVLQLGMAACVLAFLPSERWAWLRWLALGVYFWSAVSKLSVPFATGLGPALVDGLVAPLGVSLRDWSPTVRGAVAALLPLGELAAAFALAWPPTRRGGLALATILHLGLLAALGPWGLNHSAGVLLWNLAFLAQVWLLFGWEAPVDTAQTESVAPPAIGTRLARGLIVFFLLWPAGEWLGWCDPWPAWALYSGRTERTQLLVSADAPLPADLLPYVAASDEPGRVQLRIDRWCLGELGVPLYPDERVQLGVAIAVAERFDPGAEAIFSSAAHPFTGERTSERISGETALRARTDKFIVNAEPRENLYR